MVRALQRCTQMVGSWSHSLDEHKGIELWCSRLDFTKVLMLDRRVAPSRR